MQKNSLSIRLLYSAMILVLAAVACNMFSAGPGTDSGAPADTPVPGVTAAAGETPAEPATAEPTATPPIVHTLIPGEPSTGWLSNITDRDSSATAAEHRTIGGDNYALSMYERPFTATAMDYLPDLDIKLTRFSEDSTWAFVTIQLVGIGTSGSLSGNYGAELDLNIDGRGDVLILASNPQAAWTTDGVRVWQDANHDVGGAHPIMSDAPVSGDGYETLAFDQGRGTDPDMAWARVSPADQATVQIAFKLSLLQGHGKFTWGAWVDKGVFNPAWYDYNDHFTQADAGSPVAELTAYYPVKALFEVDNTCRWGVGFTPTGSEPGVCPVPPTPTPILPGKINGGVWYDTNGNSIFDVPPDWPVAGASIRVRNGGCGAPGGVAYTGSTAASGLYSISGVVPGTYCVDVSPDPSIPGGWTNKSPNVTVTVTNGGTATAYFWYWYLLTR